jgi:hypothetical protein
MAENKTEFRYTSRDVTSTQRYRILHSSQFKLLMAFWGVGVIFVGLHALLPSLFTFISGVTWRMVGLAFLAYAASIIALLYVIPWLSFTFTRFWRLTFTFQFNAKTLRLGISGKTGGLGLEWTQIRKVEETPLTFVMYYEDSSKHFILPKSVFSGRSEQRFRSLVARNISTSPAPVVEEKTETADPKTEE